EAIRAASAIAPPTSQNQFCHQGNGCGTAIYSTAVSSSVTRLSQRKTAFVRTAPSARRRISPEEDSLDMNVFAPGTRIYYTPNYSAGLRNTKQGLISGPV